MKEKRFAALLFATLLLVTSIYFPHFAFAESTSGQAGENATWQFDESTGTLTFSGTGSISVQNPVSIGYVKNIVIEDGITEIKESMFSDYYYLETVKLSNTLTEIPDWAFGCCEKLKSVDIPDSVTSIGEYAFVSCSKLENVTLGKNITSIGTSAFDGCNKVTLVNISDTDAFCKIDFKSITSNPLSYGTDLYLNNELLTEISTPDSSDYNLNYAFCGCTSLKVAKIGDGVKDINLYAFQNCTSLEKVIMSDTITDINNYSFQNCTNLKDVKFSDNLESIIADCFENCDKLEKVIFSDSLLNIENNNFPNLKKVYGYEGSYAEEYANRRGVYFGIKCSDDLESHFYDTVTTEPTCTEQGYDTNTCLDCGFEHNDNYTEPTGHTVVTDKGKAATCTDYGLTDGEHCSVCSEILKEQTVINELGHNYIWKTVTEPTCSHTGLKQKVCTVCGNIEQENVLEQLPIPTVEYSKFRLVSGFECVKIAWCNNEDVETYDIYISFNTDNTFEHIATVDAEKQSFYVINGLRSNDRIYIKLIAKKQVAGETVECGESKSISTIIK